MKFGYMICLMLLLVSCQTSPPPQPQPSRSIWYMMGLNDAMLGAVVKDNDTLIEWSGNPDVERSDYLQGYREGQATLCHSERLYDWGNRGKDFPASCDSADHAEQLRQAWQMGLDQQ